MAVGDLITSTRYNNLQTRINTIMGVGSGQFGYGQSLASAQVIIGSQVTLTQILNLRTDMIKARQHQTGLNEGPSGTGGTNAFTLVTTANQITDAYAANLESQMTTIENNKFAVAANQTSLSVLATSVRTASWNTQLVHEVTLDFSTADGARHYFNAGGTIRIRATLSGGANDSIYNDWLNMLVNAGTVIIDHTSTTNTGTSGVGSSIGFYDLTTVNQQIFTKTGSGNYAANDWTIYARKDATGRYVYLRIEFNDDKVSSPNFDEAVTGTLTSILEANRPSGTNVDVAAPAASTTTELASGPVALTYLVSSSSGAVEGSNVSWTITTTGVDNGTVFYYQILGDSTSADWVGGNTGTVTINSNTATLIKTTVEDGVYEPTESNYLVLRTGSFSGPIVATSNFSIILNKQPLGTYWIPYNPPGPDSSFPPETNNGGVCYPILYRSFFDDIAAIGFIPPYKVSDSAYEGNFYMFRRFNKQSWSTQPPDSWWKTSTPTFTRDTTGRFFRRLIEDGATENPVTKRAVTTWGQQYDNMGGFQFGTFRSQILFEIDVSFGPNATRGTYGTLDASNFFSPALNGVTWAPETLYNGHPIFGFLEDFSGSTQKYAPWGSDSTSDSGKWLHAGGTLSQDVWYSSAAGAIDGVRSWAKVLSFYASPSIFNPTIAQILYCQPPSSFYVSHIVLMERQDIFLCFGDPTVASNWGFVEIPGLSAARSIARSSNPFTAVTIIVGGTPDNPGIIWRTTDRDCVTGWTQIPNPAPDRLNRVIYSGNDQFLAVGNDGTVVQSSDLGLTWTLANTGIDTNDDLFDVVCDDQGDIAIAVVGTPPKGDANNKWYISRKEN